MFLKLGIKFLGYFLKGVCYGHTLSFPDGWKCSSCCGPGEGRHLQRSADQLTGFVFQVTL